MRTISSSVVLSLVVLVLSGCQLKPRFDVGYSVPESAAAPISGGRMVVLPFEDGRGPRRKDGTGKIFLLYIPLWPYTSVVTSRTDEIVIETSARGGRAFSAASPTVQSIEDPQAVHFTNSFPMAIAHDLQQSGACREVSFASDGVVAGSPDYVLSGRIEHTEYRSSATAYLLSIPGVLLWMLPIPMSRVTGEVSLDLELRDARSDAVVWGGRVEGVESDLRNMYQTSSMIHGTGLGAFTFQIQRGEDGERLHPESLFWWHFSALANGMESVKPAILEAIRQAETGAG